jgi:6-pyruvoyltetrahydropterin/6-carboxytetrahydropterin synthase
MHGHTFSVIVKLSGDLDQSKGWVIDFSDIDDIYHKNVQSLLDHQYLNDIDTLSNPTTEHIVAWIWDKLLPDLDGLTEVTVSESDDSSCTYKGSK